MSPQSRKDNGLDNFDFQSFLVENFIEINFLNKFKKFAVGF